MSLISILKTYLGDDFLHFSIFSVKYDAFYTPARSERTPGWPQYLDELIRTFGIKLFLLYDEFPDRNYFRRTQFFLLEDTEDPAEWILKTLVLPHGKKTIKACFYAFTKQFKRRYEDIEKSAKDFEGFLVEDNLPTAELKQNFRGQNLIVENGLGNISITSHVAWISEGEVLKGEILDQLTGIKKEVIINYTTRRLFLHEIELLRQFNHENIIQLIEHREIFYHDLSIIEFGGLQLRNFSGSNAQIVLHIFKQATSALVYMHDWEIVHADIKLDNFAMDKIGQLKLMDFGAAFNPKLNDMGIYSRGSAAPEFFKTSEWNVRWTSLSDIWSLGIAMLELIPGINPFDIVESEEHPLSHDDYKIKSLEVAHLRQRMIFCKIKELRPILNACVEFVPDVHPAARELESKLSRITSIPAFTERDLQERV